MGAGHNHLDHLARYTPAQLKALSIAPHVTGPLSMIGSGLIIKAVLSDKGKRRSTYHRLLFGMSCCDLICSFWFSLSTLPMPKGTPIIYGPVGTTTTCTAQGFFVQLSMATAMYNACLAIYYLLVSRNKWSEKRVFKIEPYMHAFPLIFGLGTAIACLPLKLFNNAVIWCWIAPFPLDCVTSNSSKGYGQDNGHGHDHDHGHGYGPECIRGDNAWMYRWIFFYIPLWFCFFVATIAMALVYWSVLKQERAVDEHQVGGEVLRRQSKRVAWAAFWYIMAFYLSWIFETLHCFFEVAPATRDKTLFPLVLCAVIFTPMQGFLNFLVYSWSRFRNYRRSYPGHNRWTALAAATLDVKLSGHRHSTEQEEAPK